MDATGRLVLAKRHSIHAQDLQFEKPAKKTNNKYNFKTYFSTFLPDACSK